MRVAAGNCVPPVRLNLTSRRFASRAKGHGIHTRGFFCLGLFSTWFQNGYGAETTKYGTHYIADQENTTNGILFYSLGLDW